MPENILPLSLPLYEEQLCGFGTAMARCNFNADLTFWGFTLPNLQEFTLELLSDLVTHIQP